MELSISNFKVVLIETMGKDLMENGFIYNKSSFEYRKQVGKNKVVVAFFFYDYKPSWIEYNFRMVFTIDEIRKEILKFSKYCNRQFFINTRTFFEGQFHPETRNKEPKFQSAYAHKIYSLESYNPEIEMSRKLLIENFLPLIEDYTDLAKFQDRHLTNYEGAEVYTPILSLLMAAKLKGLSEVEKLVQYLWIKLGVDRMSESHLDRQLIENVVPYARSNPN